MSRIIITVKPPTVPSNHCKASHGVEHRKIRAAAFAMRFRDQFLDRDVNHRACRKRLSI